MDGLIIKKKWLDLIISGKKTIEIRGSNTKNQNETIYLLESGTHRVVATAVISSTYPVSCSDWPEERDRHCVNASYAELKKRYKTPYAWVLSKIKPIEDIWYYEHPQGAVIWVKDVQPIDEMCDERIRYGYPKTQTHTLVRNVARNSQCMVIKSDEK